jgi:hypothetical protein
MKTNFSMLASARARLTMAAVLALCLCTHRAGCHASSVVSIVAAIKSGQPMDARRVAVKYILTTYGSAEYVVYDAENYRISFGRGASAKAQFERTEVASIIVGGWHRDSVAYSTGI